MYGMVNKAIEQMVCSRFGEEAWERIRARAGLDVDVFVSNESYPDAMTYALVSATSTELGLPAAAVLEAFGEHFVLVTAQEGYGAIVRSGGKTLREFLENLPDFHTRVSMIYPRLQPPEFAITNARPSSLELHYRTAREGLTPFVFGLLRGLGKMFETRIEVTLIESQASGADHDVFLVGFLA